MGDGAAGLNPVLVTEYAGGAKVEWYRDPTGGLRAETEGPRLVALLVWPTARRYSWGVGEIKGPGGEVALEDYGKGFLHSGNAVEAAERAAARLGYLAGVRGARSVV